MGSLALSPDGSQLAFSFNEEDVKSKVLKIVSASSGAVRDVVKPKLGGLADDGLVWTRDGRSLILAQGTPGVARADQKMELWRVPVDGGEPQALGLSMEGLSQLSLHPDGRQIAFTSGNFKAEVWVMENILPKLRAAR